MSALLIKKMNMLCLLVSLHGFYIAISNASQRMSFCSLDCGNVLQEMCFQNINNKSYCLCMIDEKHCKRFTECNNATGDVIYNEHALGHKYSWICYMQNTCPSGFTDNRTRALCETSTEDLVHYEMFPVLVKEFGFPNLNFKNKYCAICNGKLNYTPWDIAVDIDTCDVLNIETYLASSEPENLLLSLSQIPGCHVFPLESEPACEVCVYQKKTVFTVKFPVLSALFNFRQTKELRISEESKKSTCESNEVASIHSDQTIICGFGEIFVAGGCQRSFSYMNGIHDFRLYKQLLRTVTNKQAHELAATYISFLKTIHMYHDDTVTISIKRWNVTVSHGQTHADEQCVELELVIIANVDEIYVNVSTIQDALVPCSEGPTPYICFVPADSLHRDNFCQILNCSKRETSVRSIHSDQGFQSIITFVSLLLSVFALIVSVIIFIRCPLFYNLPGRINLCLMVSILCSQLLYLSSVLLHSIPLACLVVGVITHYAWLCSFTWMSICAFHTWFIFGRTDISGSIHASDKKYWLKRYCLAAICFPLIAVLPCLISDTISPGLTMGYGNGICFITNPIGITIGFAGPVALTLIINLVLFVATVVNIQRGPKLGNDIRSSRTFFCIYTKISSLMGLTWISAYVAELADVDWLETFSTIINGLQGVFICISFVCNKRVYKWIHSLVYPQSNCTS